VRSKPLGYRELLRRNREFRLLFWSRNISLLGDWFNLLAVLTLLDRIQGERAGAFGWILILKLLPLLLLGPAAGVVADRVDRKRLLVATDLLRAGVVLGFLVLAIWPRVGLLYALTVLQISVSAFFEPARTAALSQVCASEELVPANALGAVTWSLMLTVGSAIGGLANQAFGWQTAIVIDAATYIASALLVLPIRLPRVASRRRPVGLWHSLGFGDAIDGFRYTWDRPGVATVLAAKGAWGIGGAITLMLTVFGQRVYRVHESATLGITVFYAARGVGTALGPVLARRWVREASSDMQRAMRVSFAVGALFYVVFSLVHSLPLALLCVVLAHLGGSTLWVFSTVLLQRTVPNTLQGRIFAAELALFTLTFSASTHAFGRLLDDAGMDPFTLVRWVGWMLLAAGVPWSLASLRWPLGEPVRAAAPEPTPPLEEIARAAD